MIQQVMRQLVKTLRDVRTKQYFERINDHVRHQGSGKAVEHTSGEVPKE